MQKYSKASAMITVFATQVGTETLRGAPIHEHGHESIAWMKKVKCALQTTELVQCEGLD